MEFYLIYFLYLLISLTLTIFVGNHLHEHGKIWILNLLEDDIISFRVNDILLLLYRLLNIGYILFTLMNKVVPSGLVNAFTFLSERLGLIAIILASLHYQNILLIIVFSNFKNIRK
jgi:hypothetical protein